MRPEALAALDHCEHILHAGDIGSPDVIKTLETIAPVTAIRGNNDRASWARRFPETTTIELGALTIHLVHSVHDLEIDLVAKSVRIVVSGHSHKPSIETRAGVLYLNPGSAGPRRFKLPTSVAILMIEDETVRARIVEIPLQQRANLPTS